MFLVKLTVVKVFRKVTKQFREKRVTAVHSPSNRLMIFRFKFPIPVFIITFVGRRVSFRTLAVPLILMFRRWWRVTVFTFKSLLRGMSQLIVVFLLFKELKFVVLRPKLRRKTLMSTGRGQKVTG